jgi:FAD/FMN-containing dehydrogenase/Fe-S oxidoreductase
MNKSSYKDLKFREIPYNYTSFSDREIILKYFNEEIWNILIELRKQRVTGRSAKLLFEIIGDIFIIDRNPYIYNDFLENKKKLNRLRKVHLIRFKTISKAANNEMVIKLLDEVKTADERFFQSFNAEKRFRKRTIHILSQTTSRENISFSAYDKSIHATDATDWRVEYPAAIVYPDTIEEVPALIVHAKKAGLAIIPRGGGTGLTGGVIPVNKNTLVINLEKLRGIRGIGTLPAGSHEIPVLEVEAGAITETAMDYCAEHGYVFATDPTSAWASTIGGNIAENAGGKKAIIWGTAIDNLYAYRIANAQGQVIEIRRRNHPYRKIQPDDEVIFDIYAIEELGAARIIRTVRLNGLDIRKKGIGKDITNKALGGLPGIQKEGGDGIILSAEFVLYKQFSSIKTLCLEFFGTNLFHASKAIIDILNMFSDSGSVFLTALEHFDEKYISAINYRNKSQRTEIPKAVLLVDIESDNIRELGKASQKILKNIKKYNTEGFIASSKEERDRFWSDRKRLGAIARHTNAFKLNEDVVIPIEQLPYFADFIERLNILKELENNRTIIRSVSEKLISHESKDDTFLSSRITSFLKLLAESDNYCKKLLENFDSKSAKITGLKIKKSANKSIFDLIKEKSADIDIEQLVMQPLKKLFHGYDILMNSLTDAFNTLRLRRIIIATHMHAGDGNVHVNIPVLSNVYSMLREADETAGIIMKKTVELGGVISGEHGIGLTKLKYIDPVILDKYAEYKIESDPDDIFNPGKLRNDFPHERIYTPSLNLLKLEAFILEAADLDDLTASVSACVRCGKCKEVCNTHIPAGNMPYSPRNKILGVSLVVEAVLYESQTSNNLAFKYFKMLREISDHCTMCHNCLKPCPVDIDFGKVTLSIRGLLVSRKRAKFKAFTSFTLLYLRRRGYRFNLIFRFILLKAGYSVQRIGYFLNKPFAWATAVFLPYINAMMKTQLPQAGSRSIREILSLKGVNTIFSFCKADTAPVKSVIYFPGCGSERMFPDISIAAIALLYNAGYRVVIPPEYLCCGYPMLANGKTSQALQKSYENRVIFHRMADIISYMEIDHILVTCGTCLEMLSDYQFDTIFPGSQLLDANEFMALEGAYHYQSGSEPVLYHDPCHSPIKKLGVDKTIGLLCGSKPICVPNCCGEGGTLALSTPDIANIIRTRKRKNIQKSSKKSDVEIITTCPSCVQGLLRKGGEIKVSAKSLAVHLAENALGKNWKKDFIKSIKRDQGLERIIY